MSNNSVEIAVNDYGDRYINVINQTHFGKLPAKDIVSAIFIQKLNKPATFYIIIGSDSGLLPKYLNLLPIPEKTIYLFIELDIVFPIAEELATLDGSSNIFLTTPDEWEALAKDLNIDQYAFNDKISLVTSLAASEGHIDNYTEIYEEIKQKAFSLNFEFNSKIQSMSYIRESLFNAPFNTNPAIQLKGKGEGSALILGAGPSLGDHIQWIKENQRHITIIAVSRLCGYLIENEITPDIIVSVDAHILNYQQSEEIKYLNDTILIYAYHVNHNLVYNSNVEKYYIGPVFLWDSKLTQENFNVFGPTVTHTSLALAILMGYEKIYLAGVDLCFPNDGRSHIDGQTTNRISEAVVKTYNNEEAGTGHDFLLGIRQLNNLVKGLKGNVYNLSKNAAFIESIPYCNYPQVSFNEKKRISENIKNNQKLNIDKSLKELTSVKDGLIEVEKLCKKALEIIENPIIKIEKIKEKADKIESKLNSKKLKRFFKLSKISAEKNYFKLHNLSSENRTSEHEKTWLMNYYQAHIDGVKKLLPLFFDAIKKINDLERLKLTSKN